MNTISLQSEQNELIRRILDVKDLSLLKKVEDLLNAEEAKTSNANEPVTSYMSRQEIEAHIEQACKEAKLIQEGKLEPITRRIYCMSCNIIVTPEFSRSLKKLAIYDKSERQGTEGFIVPL